MATFGTIGTTSNIGWDLCSNSSDYCIPNTSDGIYSAWLNGDISDYTAGRLASGGLASASDYVLNTNVGTWQTYSTNGDSYTVGVDLGEDDDIEDEDVQCTYREVGHRSPLRIWRDRYYLKYR